MIAMETEGGMNGRIARWEDEFEGLNVPRYVLEKFSISSTTQ